MDAKKMTFQMISGYGQFHTNEPGAIKPEPYILTDLHSILALIDNPQQVNKSQAQWLIPSSHPSRSFREQEQHGQYAMQWADLDSNPPGASDLAGILEDILGGCDFEIYSSRSATPDNQKCRILIPLRAYLEYADWTMAQQILNDKLESVGIKPDRKNERAGQIFYLPNRGEFYETQSRRNRQFFNPILAWGDDIAAKQAELESRQAELEAARSAARARREALKTSDTSIKIWDLFNQVYTPHDWLTNAGYDQRGNTFRHPNSQSGNYSASVRADSNGVLRVNTLSPADALYSTDGAHDAFSTFTVLFHGGDKESAIKDAGDNLLTIDGIPFNKAKQIQYAKERNQQKPKNESAGAKVQHEKIIPVGFSPSPNVPAASHNAILDNESKYCSVDLLRHIDDDHLLKKLAIQTAEVSQLPVNTVLLMGLSAFSSVACRRWAVLYPNGYKLPIGMYSVAEQPSGTGKTRCLNVFQGPFQRIQSQLKKEHFKKIDSLKKREDLSDFEKLELDELQMLSGQIATGLFLTNTTPEGLEMTLDHTGGFFSAVSSEQGLFDSLMGLSYSQGANNNDVTLNGFDGGYVSSSRVSRKSYTGHVIGGLVCFAQPGSIEKVLGASNGTGLSERFLMLAEKHTLGTRDHTRKIYQDDSLEIDYSNKCQFFENVLATPENSLDALMQLYITENGHLMIAKYRNQIEPHLADGGKYSHVSLRGAASKINMQIMKIAANLHILAEGSEYQPNISDSHVKAAIGIANELLEANLRLCRDKGIMGVKAEFTAVLNYLTRTNIPRSSLDIANSLKSTKPFKDFTGGKTKLINETLDEMVTQGLLFKTRVTPTKFTYSLSR
jgi:hypothetical protein